MADLVRVLGALPRQAIVDRCVEGTDAKEVSTWLVDLESDRRLIRVRVAGEERWAAIEDASRLRDALGAALPVGVPEVFLEPVPDPLGDLVARYARTHGPFTAHDVAAWFGLGPAVVTDALRRLVGAGRVVEGELRPIESGGGSTAATSATRRCCARCAGGPSRRCAPRSNRCRPSTSPASCRPGRAWGPGCGAPRA